MARRNLEFGKEVPLFRLELRNRARSQVAAKFICCFVRRVFRLPACRIWVITSEYQPHRQIHRFALRELVSLAFAEFGHAVSAICPWQSVSDCLAESTVGSAQELAQTSSG